MREEALVGMRQDQQFEPHECDVRQPNLWHGASPHLSITSSLFASSRSRVQLGYSHFTGGFAGGQAEYVRIPYGEANCIKVPDDVYDEDALYLSDSLVTSFHQVEDTGVEEGDIVGIWCVRGCFSR